MCTWHHLQLMQSGLAFSPETPHQLIMLHFDAWFRFFLFQSFVMFYCSTSALAFHVLSTHTPRVVAKHQRRRARGARRARVSRVRVHSLHCLSNEKSENEHELLNDGLLLKRTSWS